MEVNPNYVPNDYKRLPEEDLENGQNDNYEHSIDIKIRNGFIAKVYSWLLFQIVITGIMICLTWFNESFKSVVRTSNILFILALVLAFSTICFTPCFPSLLRKVPINYINLSVFTLSLSYIVCREVSYYPPEIVGYAVILTMITVSTLTYYAWTCGKDYTMWGGIWRVLLWLLILGTLLGLFFRIPYLQMILTIGSLLLFSVYLIYDTQLILGDKTNKYLEDDYIFATIGWYWDIINIFWQILRLLRRD